MSRDAVFEEDCAWDWSEEEARDVEPFRMEYIVAGGTSPTAVAWPNPPLVTPMVNSQARSSPGSTEMPTHGSKSRTTPFLEVPRAIEHMSPPVITLDIDEEADGAPLQFWSMADLLGDMPQHSVGTTQHKEELLVAISDELEIVWRKL
jgi:hypothetical protein